MKLLSLRLLPITAAFAVAATSLEAQSIYERYQISTLAGSKPAARDGVALSARFTGPEGGVVDAAGNIFLADSGDNTIRKIATDGTVSTFAGKARRPR